MVKLDIFIIQFSQENGIYYPGEEVSGNLLIKSRERQKINSILLKFKGEVYIKWTTGSGSRKRIFSDFETIIDEKQTLLEKNNNSSELYLESDLINYPFKFILNSSYLPTSFEHREAHIRYWVKATIEIPWSINKEAIRFFTVINPLDLNLLPDLRLPHGVSDIKTICCGPCKSEPVIIEFNTNKTGFVPGEIIVFNVLIDNRSSSTIKTISAILVQHTEFTVNESRRLNSHNIDTLLYTGPSIGPRMQGKWSNAEFKIPTVCPSLLETCRIIKLGYKLTLVVNARELSMHKRLEIPIVIGTVPLKDSSISLSANIRYYKSVVQRKRKNEEDEGEQEYEEKIRINDDDNDQDFKPKYPYYKIFSLDNYNSN